MGVGICILIDDNTANLTWQSSDNQLINDGRIHVTNLVLCGNLMRTKYVTIGVCMIYFYMIWFSPSLAVCEGNPPNPCCSFDVRINKLLDKTLSGQWSETLWHSCDVTVIQVNFCIAVVDCDKNGNEATNLTDTRVRFIPGWLSAAGLNIKYVCNQMVCKHTFGTVGVYMYWQTGSYDI